MGDVQDVQIAPLSEASAGGATQTSTAKATTTKDTTIEISDRDTIDDAPKSYYSKLSIWLMILYSGLAIGSDG